MSGASTPNCATLSTVRCIASSSKTLNGWFLKGCSSEMGICWICSRWIFCHVAPGFCSETVYHPLTKKTQRKLWAKLLSCFEIMLYPGSIGTVHGHGGVVEGRQQILPHIP